MCNPIEHGTNTIARYLFAIKNDEKYFTPCATRETFRISRLLQKTDARGHRLKRSVTSIHKLATGTLSSPLHLPSHPYQFHNTICSRHSSSKLSFLLLESSLLAAIRLIDNVVGDTVISSPSPLFFFFFFLSVTRSRRERKQMLFTPCFACRNRGFRESGSRAFVSKLVIPVILSAIFPDRTEHLSKPFEYLRDVLPRNWHNEREKWRNLSRRREMFFFTMMIKSF